MSFTDIFPLENKQSLPKQSQAVSLKNSTDFYFPLNFGKTKLRNGEKEINTCRNIKAAVGRRT